MSDSVSSQPESLAVLGGDPPKTLMEGAYRRLRRDIVEGRLPPGSRLRVEHLKDDYAVGAGTLREALALLVSDTLVVAQGQRGFHVAPISLTDFEDLTTTRVLLETEALRQSIAVGDDEWEGNLLSAFHRLSKAEENLAKEGSAHAHEWEERNRIFHETLISACPSNWIHHFLRILYRQSERYRRLALSHATTDRDLHKEHTRIFEATLTRRTDEACELLAEHIRATLASIRQLPEETFSNPGKASR